MKPIEAVVKAFKLGEIKAAILAAARAGKLGDGRIFLTSVEEAIRIRTKEGGADAI